MMQQQKQKYVLMLGGLNFLCSRFRIKTPFSSSSYVFYTSNSKNPDSETQIHDDIDDVSSQVFRLSRAHCIAIQELIVDKLGDKLLKELDHIRHKINHNMCSELKTKIDKFYKGDFDAIPDIFESILKRKLSGKHEDSDDELMNEFRKGQPDVNIDQDFDSSSSSDSD